MRLLYVDDDRINTFLFEETCRVAGQLEVRSAGTGGEALAVLRQFTPDVLVIDLHLPDTDGYALLARLRAQPGLADTPAFLCSAERPADIAQAAARAGFTGCWAKPVNLKDLLAELAKVRPAP